MNKEDSTLNKYMCNICVKTYTSYSGLWNHNKKQHTDKKMIINSELNLDKNKFIELKELKAKKNYVVKNVLDNIIIIQLCHNIIKNVNCEMMLRQLK